MEHLGLLDLLRMAEFVPRPNDRLVRHQHAVYSARELRDRNLLEVFQSYQSRPVFDKAEFIISFYALEGTRARFYGIFRKCSVRAVKETPPLTGDPWELEWRRQCKYIYDLERLPRFTHLEDRLVIDWGRGTRAWTQKPSNKPVLEIQPPGRVLEPFRDYLDFSVSFAELKTLFKDEAAHPEWRSQLSAVAGVYLILAESTGQLYVGSAAGAEGIWGRWRQYARTEHGGNTMLKGLIKQDSRYPRGFRFSLLKILPNSMTRAEVITHEARFKTKLGSQAHGLNSN